ncbi:nitroreductase family protein [Kaistia dalseonensis]|nr:nitroreductase family protein [Kaistia dalseonensis]
MTRRQWLAAAGGGVAVAAGGAAAASVVGMGTMADYETAASMQRAPLPIPATERELIRLATLAPNGHNTQPWRFLLGASRIEIQPDFSRRTPVVDPDDHHLFVSLGCAAETLAISAAEAGRPGQVSFDATGDGRMLFDFVDAAPAESSLFGAITRRRSTRAEFAGGEVSSEALDALAAVSRLPGVELMLVTDPARVAAVSDLVVAGNTAQMADPAFIRELKHWLRFNPRQAMATGDGLFSAASGNPQLPTWLGGVLFDLAFGVDGENEKYRRQMRSSAGLAIFVSEKDDPAHWAQSGRACQRFLLQATALGLKQSFVNQAVEVPAMRRELASLLGLGDRRADLVVRFGYGPDMPRSLRRAVDAVIIPSALT